MDRKTAVEHIGAIGVQIFLSNIVCYSLILFHIYRMRGGYMLCDLLAIAVVYIINKINKFILRDRAEELADKFNLR